ncbi:hypothetical protein NKG05_07090 [Oerskovia sp. M15]
MRTLTIQDSGGIRATVRAGVQAVREMADEIDGRWEREDRDVSELVLGLNCGGSDGYSGITANPALGYASDRLVAYGGTSVLAETPRSSGPSTCSPAGPCAPRSRNACSTGWSGGSSTPPTAVAASTTTLAGQQGGGLTTILEKSSVPSPRAGRRTSRRSTSMPNASTPRVRLHGHARLRPRVRHGDRRGRRERRVLHDRTRLGVRLQADPSISLAPTPSSTSAWPRTSTSTAAASSRESPRSRRSVRRSSPGSSRSRPARRP